MNDLPKPSQPATSETEIKKRKKVPIVLMVLGFVLLLVLTWYVWLKGNEKTVTPESNTQPQEQVNLPKIEPTLATEVLVEGHSNIWDIAFPDNKTLIYDTRGGEIWGYSLESKQKWQIAKYDVYAKGESGLLGLTLDSDFINNRYLYMCYDAGSVRATRVARITLAKDYKSASGFVDIIPEIQSRGGRHSGCRMAMGKDDVLWVGTGDTALGTVAQDSKSLGGKVLRVDRDGKAVAGNLSEPFDKRIYSYGHRNIQGIVLFDEPAPNGAYGFTTEHGPLSDDEINWLLPGNFGWDPNTTKSGYDESVPMTDKTKYPDAIAAVWSSGDSTLAVSGMTIIKGENWSAWQGRTAVVALKTQHLRLFSITAEGKIESEKELFKEQFGRMRSVREGPDGNLYITTDNGGGSDKIIRITPSTTF